MSFQRNFAKSSICSVKLLNTVVPWLEFSEILLKFHKIHCLGYNWFGFFQNFGKNPLKIILKFQLSIHLKGTLAKFD